MMKYILNGKNPVLEPNLIKWAEWFEKGNRIVKQEKIGKVEISTIFFGVDRGFRNGKPILFETMIFGGKFNNDRDCYCSWNDALKGHEHMKRKVLEGRKP